MGARLTAGGDCWEHTHPENYGVMDFTRWSVEHDGNPDALMNGNPNPITKTAILGLTSLFFPSHHAMSRWTSRRSRISHLGRLGGYGRQSKDSS